MRRARFIGGPMHGEIRALPDLSDYISVPVFSDTVAWAGEKIEKFAPGFNECNYTRRVFQLGPWARVELWAPSAMSEPEFMRRVADLLEGVGEPTKR